MKSQSWFLVGLAWLLWAPSGTSLAAEPGSEHGKVPALTLKHLKPAPPKERPGIHPLIRLLDEKGASVLDSGQPVSLMKSCGACHDAESIAQHNYHAQVGLDEFRAGKSAGSGRPWDQGPGLFGRFNPLTYRVLSQPGDAKLDMGTADWIRTMGPRHVGGGPAMQSRYGDRPLAEITAGEKVDPETHFLDPDTGEIRAWDWASSGGMELNCLLCHMRNPNNAQRVAQTRQGKFRWASTATLLGTDLIEKGPEGMRWRAEAFNDRGQVTAQSMRLGAPQSGNCRLCHGKACQCTDRVVFENSLENWAVETTGEIFSAERMSESGMNLEGKSELTAAWDVHAERMVACHNCHYSLNNPKYSVKEEKKKPRHLRFDTRFTTTEDYLVNPDHNLAKGHTAQGTVSRHLDGTMRDCGDCHDAEAVHDFLPFKKVHFQKLSCQACHIPQLRAPTRMTTDWTVISKEGKALVRHRGVEGTINDPASLISGYRPVLLLHEEDDGSLKLGPHNIISSWFWVEGEPAQPVRLFDLRKAFLTDQGKYHPDVLAALDSDGDGDLSAGELRLDSAQKTEAIAARLRAVSVKNPRIQGEIQPYTLSHGVAAGEHAMNCCKCCHSDSSRVNTRIELADFAPGGALPTMVADAKTRMHGELIIGTAGSPGAGKLFFQPRLDPEKLYIHGTDHFRWLDIIGILVLLGTFLFIFIHGGLRIWTTRRRRAVSQ